MADPPTCRVVALDVVRDTRRSKDGGGAAEKGYGREGAGASRCRRARPPRGASGIDRASGSARRLGRKTYRQVATSGAAGGGPRPDASLYVEQSAFGLSGKAAACGCTAGPGF